MYLYQMYMHAMDTIQEINWSMKIHKKQFQILQQVGTVSPLEVNL